MAEPNWRLADKDRFGRARRPKASRVTDNMSEFVTKGKLTEAERRREGRRTKTGRKATPRTAWGDRRPVTKSTGGKDSARRKRIETVRKYNKRNFGGVNPKVTSASERTKLNRREKLPKDPITGKPGGQKYKPITRGDKRASDYQSRQNRIKRRYAAGTEGSRKITSSDDFYPINKGRVTRGRGKKVAGYMTDKVRGVDPPKGPSRVFEKGPHKRRGNPEGETRVTKRGHKGSVKGGTKTGPGVKESRFGTGKTRTKGAGQARSGGGKGGFKTKESKNFWSGETPKVRKARIEKLHNAMRQGKAWGKYMNPRAKSLIKAGASLAGGGKGRLAKALLRELGFASLEKLKATLDSRRAKKPVANLPSGYKQSEKKAFKQTKKWNKVNRKKL